MNATLKLFAVFALALSLISPAVAEEAKPTAPEAAKAEVHKDGDGHDHGKEDTKDHNHKDGDGHDHGHSQKDKH